MPLTALAPGGEYHGLFERPEGNRNLEHDPSLFELTAGREVGAQAVAQGLDDHLVVAPRQPLQGAARLGGAVAREITLDGHGRTGYALLGLGNLLEKRVH